MTTAITHDIADHPQLLLDDHLVAEQRGLCPRLESPRKHPDNPLVVPELPFERRYKFHFGWSLGSVIRDPETGVFRLYWASAQKHVLYAESEDGVRWRKPALGRAAYGGSAGNNILMPDTHAASVTHDPDDPAGEPYRMFAVRRDVGPAVFRSSDGLTWRDPVKVPTPPGGDDACLSFDPYARRYVLTFKPRRPIGKTITNPLNAEPWEIPIRHLWVSHSEDGMRNWSPWRQALVPDETDHQMVAERYPAIFVEGFLYPWRMKPEFEAAHRMAEETGYLDRLTVAPQTGYHHMDFMNMAILPYAGLYVGLLQVLNATAHTFDFGARGVPRADGGPGSDGTMEIQLVCSRDLVHWQRLGGREPFLPLGEVGAWDQSMVTPFTSNGIVRDGRHQLYYGGLRHSHAHFSRWNKPGDWPGEEGGIGLATLPRDRFLAREADADGGRLVTKPLTFAGDRLTLNAAVRGRVRVELQDAEGQPIPSHGIDDADPLTGDDLDHVVTWRGKPSLAHLADRPVRLRLEMHDADVYAFRFAPLDP